MIDQLNHVGAHTHFDGVVAAINAERELQHAKWGQQDHDSYTWLAVLGEEYGELSQAILHDTFGGKAAGTMRDELVHVAAVAVQWLECLDRNMTKVPTAPQRCAALIADATVLANATFGRAAIAALPKHWHADDECAELRFALDGEDYWLALDTAKDVASAATACKLGHVDTMLSHTTFIPAACPPDTAAVHLRTALDVVRAYVYSWNTEAVA